MKKWISDNNFISNYFVEFVLNQLQSDGMHIKLAGFCGTNQAPDGRAGSLAG